MMNNRTSEHRYRYTCSHQGNWIAANFEEAKKSLSADWRDADTIERRAMLGLLVMHSPEIL
jgi:hypothetical protein